MKTYVQVILPVTDSDLECSSLSESSIWSSLGTKIQDMFNKHMNGVKNL